MEEKKLFESDYKLPEKKEILVDVNEGKVVDPRDLDPIDIIRAVAKKHGVNISDPDKSCGKCFGRGYSGKILQTGMPIPCRCLFRHLLPSEKLDSITSFNAYSGMNREKRRTMQKYINKRISSYKRSNPNAYQDACNDVLDNIKTLSADLVDKIDKGDQNVG